MNSNRSRLEEFKIRFYLWAKDTFQQEVRAGYPLISQVLSVHAERFLRFTRSLSLADQELLASGLTKRFHRLALEKCEETISHREQELTANLLNADFAYDEVSKGWRRSDMRKALDPVVHGVFGVERCGWGMGECDFLINVGNWQVRTFLDTQTFTAKFTYFHQLIYLGEEMEPATSILTWYGICGGGTSWDMAKSPAAVVPGFTAASKKLLDALSQLSPD